MTTAMVQAGDGRQGMTRATRDDQLVTMWLEGKPAKTVKEYSRNVQEFLGFVGRDLRDCRLEDVQAFAASLEGKGLATRRAKLSALKSLFTFAAKIGYLPFNLGAPVKLPKAKDTLAERIMPEQDVIRMIALTESPRDKALLTVLYAGGLRNSEACGLSWKDVRETTEGAVLTVYGKGEKTRFVPLSKRQWKTIKAIRNGAGDDAPVFPSRKGGGHLNQSAVNRIVKKAARVAGLGKAPSPHWLRHACASHALDRGCPVHVLQASLGHTSLSATSRYVHVGGGEGASKYLGI